MNHIVAGGGVTLGILPILFAVVKGRKAFTRQRSFLSPGCEMNILPRKSENKKERLKRIKKSLGMLKTPAGISILLTLYLCLFFLFWIHVLDSAELAFLMILPFVLLITLSISSANEFYMHIKNEERKASSDKKN